MGDCIRVVSSIKDLMQADVFTVVQCCTLSARQSLGERERPHSRNRGSAFEALGFLLFSSAADRDVVPQRSLRAEKLKIEEEIDEVI